MQSRCRLFVSSLGSLIIGLLFAGKLHGEIATPIGISWNSANDPSILGYAIYYGPTNTADLARIDVGLGLNCVISNLTIGVTYRIYAVSYGLPGIESIPSNEVLFVPSLPVAPRLTISRLSNGNIRLNSVTAPGKTCVVQYTTNLSQPNWRTLTNTVANAAGNIEATDASARTTAQRFYRLFIP